MQAIDSPRFISACKVDEQCAEDEWTDSETSSVWDALSGEAVAGPLARKRLERIKSTVVLWFGWKDFCRDSLVYGVKEG